MKGKMLNIENSIDFYLFIFQMQQYRSLIYCTIINGVHERRKKWSRFWFTVVKRYCQESIPLRTFECLTKKEI